MKPESLHIDRVVQLIASELCLPTQQVTPESHLTEDLPTDSLDRVELLMALEDEFQTEISDEDAEKFVTVQDIINYTRSLPGA